MNTASEGERILGFNEQDRVESRHVGRGITQARCWSL